MRNFKALEIEKKMDSILLKINTAKNRGRQDLVDNYRKILTGLIKNWEIVKGDTVNNNPVMYKTLEEKIFKNGNF